MFTCQRWHTEIGMYGVWGVQGVWEFIVLGKGRHPPHSNFIVWYVYGDDPWKGREGVKQCYLSSGDGVSCNISSYVCGSWHFPRFLLSEGSLTHIYMATFMFLITPCTSLSAIVKHFGLTGCPVEWLWWCMGDGALRYSLSLSLNVLPNSPIYSSRQLMCGHLYLYMTPLFLNLLSLFLRAMKRGLMVLLPLNAPGSPSCCMSFWTFPKACGCMVPLWRYISGCFSFCLNSCSFEIFTKTELNFVRRQAFTSFQTWVSLGLRKMLILIIFQHLMVCVLVYPAIFMDTMM